MRIGDKCGHLLRRGVVDQSLRQRQHLVVAAAHVGCQCRQHRVVGEGVGLVVQTLHGGEGERTERVEVGEVGPTATHRVGHLRQGAFQHAGHVEQSPGTRRVEAQQVDECGRVFVAPLERVVAVRAEPVEHLVGRPLGGGQPGSVECPSNHLVAVCRSRTIGSRPGAAQTQPQQRWRDDGGDEYDDEQRTVLVGVQHARGEADRGEDEAHLAAGHHADADEHLVGSGAERAHRGQQFAGDGQGAHGGGKAQHRWLRHGAEIGVDADLQEEHGDEDVAHRAQVAGDAFVVLATPQAQAGHEGTDDEGELGGVGQHREPEGDGHCRHHHGGTRRCSAVHEVECLRHREHADEAGDEQEGHRQPQGLGHQAHAHVASGDHLGDDGEDDEAEHIIGHGCAQHDACLDGGEGAQVAEHTGRDAHAGGGERGAEEHSGLGRLAEGQAHQGAHGEGCGNTDDGHHEGGAADLAEFGQVHLHAHSEQQKEHTDLGQHTDRHAAVAGEVDEAEHRRADDHPGGDLAEHTRDTQALGEFAHHLGSDEHDQQVGEQTGEVERAPARRNNDRQHAHVAGVLQQVGGGVGGRRGQHPAAAAHGDDRVVAEHAPQAHQHTVAATLRQLGETRLPGEFTPSDHPIPVGHEHCKYSPLL